MSSITNSSNINETFIIEPVYLTGNSTTWSACTGLYTNMVISCEENTYMTFGKNDIGVNGNLIPTANDTYSVGSKTLRFREINTVSGSSTYWSASTVNSATINLGLDSSGNSRIITADSILLSGDILNPGTF